MNIPGQYILMVLVITCVPDSTDFSMGTGDFTLEGWFYFNATGTNTLFGQRNSSAAESQFLEIHNGHT